MIKDIIESNEKVDLNKIKIEKLKQIIPNCFNKYGNLDIELLKKEFSDSLDFKKESFELNFLGKSYAKMVAGLDTETVIEPDIKNNLKEENKDSKNIYISGDNLDALKHLLKAYERKIKCIYIDPPYNTGNDGFAYNDSFKFDKKTLINKLDINEDEAERILGMTSTNSSSHSAWLTFMYPRLYLAEKLLKDEGIIIISIDDNEQANLKLLCDMIFGEENFIGTLPTIMNLKGNNDEFGFAGTHEYTIIYAKNKNEKAVIKDFEIKDEEELEKWEEDEYGYYKKGANLKSTGVNAPREKRPNLYFPIFIKKQNNEIEWSVEEKEGYFPIYPITNGHEMSWRWSKLKFKEEHYNVIISEDGNEGFALYKKQRPSLGEIPTQKPKSTLYKPEYSSGNGTARIKELFGEKLFPNPKPVSLIKDLISIVVDSNDIVLDFFSGSATSSEAIMKLNSEKEDLNIKYIAVQLQEKSKINSEFNYVDEIEQERIRRAAKQIKENTNANIDYGFKHYTLKETPDDLLNKLELFKPEIVNDNYNIYKEYGIDTILETWKLKDGYEFTTNIDTVDCGGYEAYKCKECLYVINPNITVKNIQALLDKYNLDDTFVCDKLVIFGYSFRFDEIEMIKNNIKQVKNFKNIDVKVYTRY